MKSEEATVLANRLMNKHGLGGRWIFEFDSAKRRLGKCNYRKRLITLSRHMTELLDRVEIEDVILHEIAHALVGTGHGHDGVWRRKAVEIGCNGQRLYCGEARVKPKYKGVCPKCGRVITRHRRKKIACGKCSPTFKKELMFIWSLND